MGKTEEEQNLPSSTSASDLPERNVDNRRWFRLFRRFVGIKCVLVVLLSVAIFLSAVFWLPPFLGLSDRDDLDLDSQFKDHDIVATFILIKPVSFLEDNILQFEDAIYNEINVPSKVVVLSLKPLKEANRSQVIFSIDPEEKDTRLSEAERSLVREPFKSLVIRQLYLHLTPLFGDAEFFEVLKFPGGITIIPPQSVFLLQKAQIHFNFTLNFSIYEIQLNFKELISQLKTGLHLAPYENLYISLTNKRGSTIAAPTIVQSSVVLAVGNPTQRLKQLAQTITGSHSRNLGLNNTVFGKVKQVSLSSYPQYLHGSYGSPSPAPAPQPHYHHNHHHHHHHNHHHIAPAISPEHGTHKGSPTNHKGATPLPEIGAPASVKNSPFPPRASPPTGCHIGYRSKGEERRRPRLAPEVAPSKPPHVSSPRHSASLPRKQEHPSKSASNSIPVSSPLPSVVFAHSQPPSESKPDNEHFDTRPEIAPAPSSSSSSSLSAVQLSISLFLAFVLRM